MRLEDIGEIFGDSVEPIAREDTKSEEHEEVYDEKQQVVRRSGSTHRRRQVKQSVVHSCMTSGF